MHRARPAHAILVTTTIILLTACGSESSPASTAAESSQPSTTASSTLERSIAATLQAVDAEGALTFTAEEASCLAGRVVADVGADRLIELGADQGEDLTALAWTTAERDVVFGSLRSCVNIEEQLTTFFASDPATPPDVAACLAHSYAQSEVLADALFSTGPDPDVDKRVDEALGKASESCL